MAAPNSVVTAPLVNQSTGGLYADNGAFVTDGNGNITINSIAGGVASVNPSNGATIATAGLRQIKVSGTSNAQVSNLTLATGLSGQDLTVINENATGTSTIILTGNVIAALGTTTVTISGGAGAKFSFDSTQGLWIKL